MKIFIVDDSEILRRSLKSMLNDIPGIDISGEAESVQEGVQGILSTRPDAVVLDIRLADGSGLDVLKSVRTHNSSTVFIIFTNYPAPQYRELFLKEGAAYFFEKAAEEEMLMRCVLSMTCRNNESNPSVPAVRLPADR